MLKGEAHSLARWRARRSDGKPAVDMPAFQVCRRKMKADAVLVLFVFNFVARIAADNKLFDVDYVAGNALNVESIGERRYDYRISRRQVSCSTVLTRVQLSNLSTDRSLLSLRVALMIVGTRICATANSRSNRFRKSANHRFQMAGFAAGRRVRFLRGDSSKRQRRCRRFGELEGAMDARQTERLYAAT